MPYYAFQVTTEILDDLGIGSYTIKLNHRRLLDAMLDIAGVPAQKFRCVKLGRDSQHTSMLMKQVSLDAMATAAHLRVARCIPSAERFCIIDTGSSEALLVCNKPQLLSCLLHSSGNCITMTVSHLVSSMMSLQTLKRVAHTQGHLQRH